MIRSCDLSIRDVALAYDKVETLIGVHRRARDQGLRARRSIPLNLAEGNGKTTEADRWRSLGGRRCPVREDQANDGDGGDDPDPDPDSDEDAKEV